MFTMLSLLGRGQNVRGMSGSPCRKDNKPLRAAVMTCVTVVNTHTYTDRQTDRQTDRETATDGYVYG